MGKGPSLGVIQPSNPQERSFFAPKFDDRTQEDTLAKERWARSAAFDLPKMCTYFEETWMKTEPRSSRLRKFGVFPCHPL